MDNIVWLPAIAMPVPFDIPGRIKELRSFMEPNFPLTVPEGQHINIKAIIKLYEDGQIDGTKEIFVKDGKIVSHEETLKGPTYSWAEGGYHYQMQNKCAYGSGPFPPNFHQIRMLVRLIPELGGDGSVTGIIAMNDTGSC